LIQIHREFSRSHWAPPTSRAAEELDEACRSADRELIEEKTTLADSLTLGLFPASIHFGGVVSVTFVGSSSVQTQRANSFAVLERDRRSAADDRGNP
jgi:hypothetical protein